MVEEEAVVGQVGSVKGKRKPKRKQRQERSPREAVGVLWMVIDEYRPSVYDRARYPDCFLIECKLASSKMVANVGVCA